MSLPAIVLAAGGSTRLGRPKQLLQHCGESLVHRAARLALEAGFSPVLVVLGAQADEIEPALADLETTVVHNDSWKQGLASSIRAGLAALPAGSAGAAFLLCDQPALDLAVLLALRGNFTADPSRPAACEYEGKAGIPAIFPWEAFASLRALQGDRGAKALLDGAQLTPFPGGATDVDTPEDAERHLKR